MLAGGFSDLSLSLSLQMVSPSLCLSVSIYLVVYRALSYTSLSKLTHLAYIYIMIGIELHLWTLDIFGFGMDGVGDKDMFP